MKESFEEMGQNIDRIKDYDDYNDLVDYGIQYSPAKDTNLDNFLKEEMQLTDRILEYNVYVNGKEIDPSFWSDLIVTPDDRVAIVPYMGLLETIHDIEEKIRQEIINNQIHKQRPSKDLLTSSEIKTLNNFYFALQDNLYDLGYLMFLGWDGVLVHILFTINFSSIKLLKF